MTRSHDPASGGSQDTDLVRVDDLLSQEGVLPGVTVEQAPIHLQVPDQGVAGTDDEAADVQVEEDLGVSVGFT